MNDRPNSSGREVTLQLVAPRVADHEKMPSVYRLIRHALKRHAWNGCERRAISLGDSRATTVPLVQVGQLDAQERCLHLVEATVDAGHLVMVLLPRPIVPQHAKAIRQVIVVGGDGPAIAKSAEVFAWVKAKAAAVRQGAGAAAAVRGPVGLGRILDYFQSVTARNCCDCIHIGRLAV
jgi:hypothetical protein